MTGSRFLLRLAFIVVVACAVTARMGAQGYGSVDEFRHSSSGDKVRILNGLQHDTSSLPDQLTDVLIPGLTDASAEVRDSALRAIASRVGTPQIDRETWRRFELPALQALGPRLAHSLEDSDVHVRRSAIEAIASLELDFTGSGKAMRALRPVTARLLATRYNSEPDALTRSRIVNVFAWFSIHPGIQRDSTTVLGLALSDPSPAVCQAALVGVGMQRIVNLLSKAAEFLTHDEVGLRISAAQALVAFGRDARPYVPRIEAALESESNSLARREFVSAIAQINR
jgi:HEAT repeat protein